MISIMTNGSTWQQAFADPVVLRHLVTEAGGGGVAAVLRQLGVRPHVYYYDRLRESCRAHGIPYPEYVPPRSLKEPRPGRPPSAFADKERIRAAVAYGTPAAALRFFGHPGLRR